MYGRCYDATYVRWDGNLTPDEAHRALIEEVLGATPSINPLEPTIEEIGAIKTHYGGEKNRCLVIEELNLTRAVSLAQYICRQLHVRFGVEPRIDIDGHSNWTVIQDLYERLATLEDVASRAVTQLEEGKRLFPDPVAERVRYQLESALGYERFNFRLLPHISARRDRDKRRWARQRTKHKKAA